MYRCALLKTLATATENYATLHMAWQTCNLLPTPLCVLKTSWLQHCDPSCVLVLILVLKLTLIVEVWVLLSTRWPPLLQHPASRFVDGIQLSGMSHRDSDYTAMIVILHWRLHAIILAAIVHSIQRFKQHGCHMSCALIGKRCRLATYAIWVAFEWGLNTSWGMQTEGVE